MQRRREIIYNRMQEAGPINSQNLGLLRDTLTIDPVEADKEGQQGTNGHDGSNLERRKTTNTVQTGQ